MSSYILRDIQWDLEQILKQREKKSNVILIEGPRQVGKTTLVRETLKVIKQPYKEFNLEAEPGLAHKIDTCDNFQHFTQLVEALFQFPLGEGRVLFLDEAQESSKLGQFVRFMKEDWSDTTVILSGSSMSRIFRQARYPVGRVTPVHVQPFSFKEFLRAGDHAALLAKLKEAADIKFLSSWSNDIHELFLSLLEKYLEVGGLPEVVVQYFSKGPWNKTRENLLYGYYQDFRRVYGEPTQIYLTGVLKTTAHLLGMPFKNSHAASLLDGGKNQKIIEAISQLEAWKMIRTVEQRGTTVEKHFHPKRYLFDVGIARQLREAALPSLSLFNTTNSSQRSAFGGVLENVVANGLTEWHQELTGWRKSSSGSEIDFVIKRQGQLIPVECKAALKIKNSHLYGLRDFLKIHEQTVGVIVGLAPFETRPLSDGQKVIIVPMYLLGCLESIFKVILKDEE